MLNLKKRHQITAAQEKTDKENIRLEQQKNELEKNKKTMQHFTAVCKNSTKRMNQNYLKTRYKDKIR